MSIADNIFGFLHTETQRVFGESTFLFFPTARGGNSYTVAVRCTAAPVRQRDKEKAGLLTMDVGTQVFNVAAADLPFEPRAEDLVCFGSAIEDPATTGAYMQDPDNPPQKYRITDAAKAPFHAHWRLTCQRH